MILEGKIIGNRYEIIEKIGNGGMATVYKAKCHVLNRYVAIKVLRDEFTTDEEFIKRFNSEAQSAASLTHPNIVSIYDVGNEGNLYYIVMELIQGKTLKEIIEEDGALPWKWSVNIAIQISSALEVAHKNRIVHRDIKPHNIIITEDGIAKVTDFGIAKAVSNSTITAFGTTIGSVHYFSPEHARGGFTDAKSDLYSLGVVMYEMLTGRVPFDADTPVSIALKHMQEKPIEPIKLNPAIPFAVNQIILKAMQKESNLRYQTATEMLRDLSMALKNPDGNFVMNRENLEYGQTQRIPTLNSEVLKNKEESGARRKNAEDDYEKKSSNKSKIIIGVIIFLVVCALCFLVPYFIMTSSSPKNIDVPQVTGMIRGEAESLLKEKKITVEIIEEYNSEVDKGKVISQDPPAGYKVLQKTGKVKIVISKGTEVTTVPKVAGETFEDAESKIKSAKLKVEKIEETSQKIQEGIVIKQDPSENTSLNAGDTVKVYVSKGTGIKQVAVPSVIGKSEEDAKKELTDGGFEVSIVNEEDRSKKSGEVLKQSLDVGKTVDEGTKIIITVNKIPEKKRASIFVNVKSLTGGYTETKAPTKNNKKDENKVDDENKVQNDEVEEPKIPEIQKTVKIKVTVDGETIYDKDVDKNTTNLNVGEAVGTGTVEVKLFMDDIRKDVKYLDLSTTTSCTFD